MGGIGVNPVIKTSSFLSLSMTRELVYEEVMTNTWLAFVSLRYRNSQRTNVKSPTRGTVDGNVNTHSLPGKDIHNSAGIGIEKGTDLCQSQQAAEYVERHIWIITKCLEGKNI